jgi:hypothetical protein
MRSYCSTAVKENNINENLEKVPGLVPSLGILK